MREKYYRGNSADRFSYRNKRSQDNRTFLLAGIAVLVCLSILAVSLILYTVIETKPSQTTQSSSADGLFSALTDNSSEAVSSVSAEATSSAPVSSAPVSSESASSEATSSKVVSSKPMSSQAVSSKAPVSSIVSQATSSKAPTTSTQNWTASGTVTQSKAVPMSYFDDAALIGDSRAVGLPLYTDLGAHITSFAVTSCTAKMVLEGTDKVAPIIKKIEAKPNQFKKVYIMLGLNEIGHTHSTIMNRYKTIIDRVRACQPNAIIYIQTVLPITKWVQQHHGYLKKDRIIAFNKELVKLAAEKKVHLLDPTSVFVGKDGYMVNAARASVGNETGEIHFNPTYTKKWLEYLRTHTVQ